MAKTNVKTKSALKTHEGAEAPVVNAYKGLRRAVMACMLWEDQFYESGVDIVDRIKHLVPKVTFAEAAQVAIDAREKFKLRHVPLLVVREMLRIHKGRQMGDVIARIIQRPDEMGELLSLYQKDGKDQPLTAQLKVGLARAFKKFNEYALSKWDAREGIRLRDVMFLVHPRAGDNEALTALYKKIADDKLTPPETWEVMLSGGADKKAVFTKLLTEKTLGGLALLRNLRNMQEANVDPNLIWQSIATMNTERVLPFRFLSAAKYGKQFEPALEGAMFRCLAEQPKLLGKTALLIDHSGSMNSKVSGKSELSRLEAASAVAVLLREMSDSIRVFAFSDWVAEIAPRRGFALVDAIKMAGVSGSTFLGIAVKAIYQAYPQCERLIVITDEQSADKPPHPQGLGYIVNVASNRNGIAYGPWVAIDGWSEAVIDFIREHEQAD